METCIYCNKVFTKRGVKRHTNKCNKGVNIHSVPGAKSYITIHSLPYDCINIIREYLLHKETYITFKRFFSTHMNYALSCKLLCNHLMLDSNEYHLLSNQEIKTKIHRKSAISTYGLTEKELDIIVGNKKHRQVRQRDKIYPLVNIMNYSFTKYGSYNNYIMEKTRIELEKKDKEKLNQMEIKKRKELISGRLTEYNITLRHDSTLCYNFIENNIGNVDEIVVTMIEMEFYFKYTNYFNIVYQRKSNYIDNARSYRLYDEGNSYYSLSNGEKQSLSMLSKETALQEWCMKQGDYNKAISIGYLPVSLHDKIIDFFS